MQKEGKSEGGSSLIALPRENLQEGVTDWLSMVSHVHSHLSKSRRALRQLGMLNVSIRKQGGLCRGPCHGMSSRPVETERDQTLTCLPGKTGSHLSHDLHSPVATWKAPPVWYSDFMVIRRAKFLRVNSFPTSDDCFDIGSGTSLKAARTRTERGSWPYYERNKGSLRTGLLASLRTEQGRWGLHFHSFHSGHERLPPQGTSEDADLLRLRKAVQRSHLVKWS